MNANVIDASSPQFANALPLPGPFGRLGRAQQLRLGIGIIALVALVVGAVLMMRQPDWKVLFSNVTDKDGGAIVAQLAQMNVPYRYSEGGGAILVPAERVHDVRLRLASQGLPKGSVVGFESMDANRFGMTQFQERLSFQRGLEGELTRSIQSLASVQGARVHLALPNQNGFFREQQKPSASVLLTLHPGRTLDRAQVAGIVNLVASSVPELTPKAVSVVDDAGTLLSANGDPQANADQQQLQYTQTIENMHMRRIVELLEPIVGRGNVKAQVSAELDFSQTESTMEQHRPNGSTENAAIRSQQVVESSGSAGGANGPSGVPGAASNQPPGGPTAPINGQAAGAAGAATASAQTAGGNTRRESTTNYEVDKTVRVVRAATGTVKRLNAAVVVNHRSTADSAGKVTTKALSEEELGKITALVREAIGYSKDRGDSVNVMNAAFVTDATPATELAWWQRPDVRELARTAIWPVGLLLLALIVVLGVVRPMIKAMAQPVRALPAPEPQLDAVVAETPERPALLAEPAPPPPPTVEQLRLEDAKRIAKDNPVAVANIVKTWVSGEAAATA